MTTTQQFRVALIDDERSFLDYSSDLLDQSADFVVVDRYLDGQEALDSLSDIPPDVVIVDVAMRGISGFTISRRLLKQYPELKVIIVSEADDEHFFTLSKDIGATAFLPKHDFSAEALHSCMQAA